jgi:hypothetical protein
MHVVNKDHLEIDTRPRPTVDTRLAAPPGVFADEVSVLSEQELTHGGGQAKTLTVNATTSMPPVATPTFQTVYSSTPTPTTSTASVSTEEQEVISGGAIFGIILGTIAAITLLIVLLTQLLKQSRRRKEDMAALQEVLDSGIITERAKSIGLKKLQEASSKKWAAEEVLLQITAPLKGQLEQEMKRFRVEGLEERRLLGALFELEGETAPRPLGGAD